MNTKISCKDTVSCVYHPLSLYEQLSRPGNIKRNKKNIQDACYNEFGKFNSDYIITFECVCFQSTTRSEEVGYPHVHAAYFKKKHFTSPHRLYKDRVMGAD